MNHPDEIFLLKALAGKFDQQNLLRKFHVQEF